MLFGVSVDDVSLGILVKAIDETVSNLFVKESIGDIVDFWFPV